MTRLPMVLAVLAISSMWSVEATSAARHVRRHSDRSAAAIVGAATKAGTAEPAAGTFINASATLPFVDGTIYHIYTAPERVTDIVLQPGEALSAVAAGDTARWVIGDTTSGAGSDKRAHVLVKPVAEGLTTNLVITTDRRTYHLTLSSASGGAMSAISWSYPQDDLIALKRAQLHADAVAPVASALDVDQLHFTYEISGDQPEWRPLRAFDDGRQTFIEFPPSFAGSEAPPLFVIGAAGEAQLVNYRVRGRYYVVDRLFDRAELRLGAKRQEVVRITRVQQVESRGHRVRRPS